MKNVQDLRDDEELRDIFTKLERFYADLRSLDSLLPDFAEVEVKKIENIKVNVRTLLSNYNVGRAESLFPRLKDIYDSSDFVLSVLSNDVFSLDLDFINDLMDRIYSYLLKYRFVGPRENEIDYLKASVKSLNQKLQLLTDDGAIALNEMLHKADEKYKKISSLEEDSQSKFAEITSNLESNAKKIAETVGRLSTDAVSGRFNIRATEERKSADRMQYGAIFLMCVAISLIFLSALKMIDFWGWQDILIRSLATVTLFITAGYLASESNKHRKLQHKYERIHLDLSAIDPFILNLEDDMQKSLKNDLARRVFISSHNADAVNNSAETESSTIGMADVMLEMLKILKDIQKNK